MAGRYGSDDLSKFTAVLFLAVALIGLFISGTAKTILLILELLLLSFNLYRTFSKDTYRRSTENTIYLNYRRRFFTWAKNIKERFVQRKDYKFFTCPGCRAVLRVPRGHGKINISCRRCGRTFIGKS